MTDPEDPAPFINTARDHLRTAAKLEVTDLDDYAVEASCTDEEAATDIEEEVKKHFLAACAEVLELMERGNFDEARGLQAEISAWVDYHTEEND
jgi:hypothetical protein